VHLGDRDVPNALIFIDKYTQVPRILSPIVQTIEKLDELVKDPAMEQFIRESYGGVEAVRKEILQDFFKHGFDGRYTAVSRHLILFCHVQAMKLLWVQE